MKTAILLAVAVLARGVIAAGCGSGDDDGTHHHR